MDHRQPITPKLLSFLPSSFLVKKELVYALFFLLVLISSFVFFNFVSPLQPQTIFDVAFFTQLFTIDKSSITSNTCDYSSGRWVSDVNRPLKSYTENCPLLDPGFRCRRNGRTDDGYLKWRWQPNGCDLPRFDARDLLERSRNGRIVFAGDSIGRNQWESMLCMLSQGVSNLSTIYEVNGSPITKHKGYLSIRFSEYNLTVEYYRVPFLVITGPPPKNSSSKIRSAIRVDKLHWRSLTWVGADVLVFNAGHWWSQDKTTKMGYYFQEGGTINNTMDAIEALRRSLQTWKSWAMQSLDADKSHIFFRSYSPIHYRQVKLNGTWNDGGGCDKDVKPETNDENPDAEPVHNHFISETVKQMRSENRKAQFLNITYLTDFRRDGHPSLYREPSTPVNAPQDCSHWCLPGIPDTWNELLYAQLVSDGFRISSHN
ncbi:Trichome birefringence-like, N-terminal domain [Dillenia turbinata]|uniref:Trichome birefringence-like, N-terminal domain n=1 Tax=Dillenia turbinata TaxID=194707 RepID=A0AAN8W9B3_9MAGN